MNPQVSTKQPGLNDLTYNLVTVLQKKAKAVRAYETYIADAQKAGSEDCAKLLQRIHEDDLRHIEELKRHVAIAFSGMDTQGQSQNPSQNQSQSQLQNQSGSQARNQAGNQAGNQSQAAQKAQ